MSSSLILNIFTSILSFTSPPFLRFISLPLASMLHRVCCLNTQLIHLTQLPDFWVLPPPQPPHTLSPPQPPSLPPPQPPHHTASSTALNLSAAHHRVCCISKQLLYCSHRSSPPSGSPSCDPSNSLPSPISITIGLLANSTPWNLSAASTASTASWRIPQSS